ncbi:nicotinate phosphoribosyltransferase [Methylocystis echinoides]|uniref:Nicotinate phosphoribosyltransferase n=1 Tax=Methylocystis echinoides TaxID=29468 RepID=A0A9W6LRI0_9HYPH|nr:nicotinate phosphoribosyltransferase [Methylocystis echinoides]GLI92304.1 nicotinate phosphoribosyltransferase [Methylocystis echinoides]
MNCPDSALLTDLYQLKMAEAYLARGEQGTAVFEFFVRRLPPTRGFLLAAGLEQAIAFLESYAFSRDDIDWLASSGMFGAAFLEQLASLRFAGDVHAMPEGTVFFPDEPILRVTAPLPQAQLVETRLINLLHFQTLIASKAARHVLLAQNRQLVDFGLRRAHGGDAGLLAARASYIAGYDGTATVLAGRLFDIPLFGTMAHSFVQAFDDEAEAFEAFAESHPEDLVLLLDTYDTEAAARKLVTLTPRLRARGISIKAVRLDSGDLIALSRSVRAIFDEGGLRDVAILASGGLDDAEMRAIVDSGGPVDGFGVGTSLTTSIDAPALDCAYKLTEYAGRPRRKRSIGKETLPGRKQVWRRFGPDGRMCADVVSLEDDAVAGEAQLQPVMRAGKRLLPPPTLGDIRARSKESLARLPEPLRALDPAAGYHVERGGSLLTLARNVDRRRREV